MPTAENSEPFDSGGEVQRGQTALKEGRRRDAWQAFQAVLARDEKSVLALLGLAELEIGTGRIALAEERLRRVREIAPDDAETWRLTAGAQLRAGDAGAAEAAVREAIRRAPAPRAELFGLLAETLKAQYRQREALDVFEQSLAIDPTNTALDSAVLFQRNYFDWPDPRDERRRAELWDERHARKLRPEKLEFANNRDPDRRLRVGYVSPDFRWHAVAHFARLVLAAHDRREIELFCYSNNPRGDLNSQRFAAIADHWIPVRELSDDDFAARIRSDRIDVLVDLAGHSAHHRLLVFARKPAPVQMTWLGYCNTTGLSAIDYRVIDPTTDPPGLADECSVEKPIRLPRGFHCFAPPEENPPVRPSPAAGGGAVTFGSFNNPQKHTAEVIALWCEVLRAVPGSRMLLKSQGYTSPAARLWFLRRFAEGGVDAARVRLIGSTASAAEHWSSFGLVDVALDPFPYNGTTTTCDALWMGVPVVTLEGRVHRARVGTSLLRQIGRPEWIATTAVEYLAIAARLAEEARATGGDRARLREAMRASPLCDARGLAADLERVYRESWQRWLAGETQRGFSGERAMQSDRA